MNFDVLAVNANPLLNLVHGGDFAPGAVNRVAAMAVAAEGKGVNVARVLAQLGAGASSRPPSARSIRSVAAIAT